MAIIEEMNLEGGSVTISEMLFVSIRIRRHSLVVTLAIIRRWSVIYSVIKYTFIDI